jgi:transposase
VNHLAIDLGGRESQVCIRQPDGAILEEYKHPTRKLDELLRRCGPSRVILETSAEAFRIADAAVACGHEVRVVPSTLARTLGIGSRGVKNDKKDAQVLSAASCRIDLPSVHIPSAAARELKSVCGSREILVETRTKLVNNVRGWMRTQLWRIRGGATSSFPDRVRAHAQTQTSSVPPHIERMLGMIEAVSVQITAADRQVHQTAQAHRVCPRLMTVPGVGPVTAVRFVAAIDRIERFDSAHHVQSYLGLTPGENSSSMRLRMTSITKAGPAALRWTLVQAAWSTWRTRPDDPMVQWARQIAERRGRSIAIVALARKLAGLMFALWRDQTTYRPAQAAHSPHPRPTHPPHPHPTEAPR